MRGRAEVFLLRERLDRRFERIDRVANADIELQAEFARYLCILVSGFLEKSVQELAIECCRRMAGGAVRSFAIAQLDRTRNPSVDSLRTFVGSFSLEWLEQLDGFLTEERRDAIGSIVGLRNDAAHGGSAGITYARVRLYYAQIKQTVDFLSDLFDPVQSVA